jgi:hypothetical protein
VIPLEEIQVPAVTRADIEALYHASLGRDTKTAAFALIALGSGHANVCALLDIDPASEYARDIDVHPVDARDECVRVITEARRKS